MKTMSKRLLSVVMIATLFASQIGCAGKVTKISEPLDQVEFDEDYSYTVKLKHGNQIEKVTGDQIAVKKENFIITTEKKRISMRTDKIMHINGVSNETTGRSTFQGMKIGAIAGGILVGLPLALAGKEFGECGLSDTPCDEGHGTSGFFIGLAMGGLIGALGGGLIGTGIGALIPKHDRILITPVIEPTTSGVNAGANLRVNF